MRNIKNLLLAIIGLLFFACGGKETEDSGKSYADFNIQVDTVTVDSGGEILMAATNGFGHALKSDLTVLYNWDYNSSQLEIVDLESFELLRKQPIEMEGPEGVGKNSYQMKMIADNQLAFIAWDAITLTDLEGKVSQRIKYDEPWMTEGLEEKGSLTFIGLSADGKKMYSTFMNFKKMQPHVLELDLENKTKKLLNLPEFEKLDRFRIVMSDDGGNIMSMSAPNLSMSLLQDKIIFYTNAINSVYRYDPKTDSLVVFKYDNQLTANEKVGTYKNEVSSMGELSEESAKIREEVNFTRLIWDDQNKVFYRFTYLTLPKTGEEETKTKSFVTILSPDMAFLGEKEITYLGIKYPNPQFVKDGKAYLFINLDDELAYVRLSMK